VKLQRGAASTNVIRRMHIVTELANSVGRMKTATFICAIRQMMAARISNATSNSRVTLRKYLRQSRLAASTAVQVRRSAIRVMRARDRGVRPPAALPARRGVALGGQGAGFACAPGLRAQRRA